MSETGVVKTTDGKPADGTQAPGTPEAEAAAAAQAAAAKVAKDKATADAKLLDGNGNPKSAEVLAAEAATADKAAATNTEDQATQADLEGKVGKRAKQVEDLVKSAGIAPVELLQEADPESGDLSVAHKAKLLEKHGEAVADLIEGNVQKMLNDTRKNMKAKDAAVFKQVEAAFKGITEQSGEKSWKELAGWVKDNVDTATRKVYNTMLTAGGMQAQLAVQEMMTAFKKGNDITVSAQLIDGDSTTAVVKGGYITRSEYMKQLDVLDKAGHDYNTSPEIAALNKRREKSMRNGK